MTQETHCSTLRGCGLVLWAVVGLVCAGVIPVASSIANATEPAAAASPAKAVVPVDVTELQVFPAALQLSSIRDSRRVLVTGTTAAGVKVDLTQTAEVVSQGPQVQVDADGFVQPVSAGATKLTIKAGGKTIEVPVTVANADPLPVSFVREVMPSMSKMGCNAGTCHGAQDGKNGFKLSLRGYDPKYDYDALVDELSGRRFDRANPSQSLMLLKPTQAVPHVGGFLFDESSRAYALMLHWIAEGAQLDNVTRVQKLEIFPQSPVLDREGMTVNQIVVAHFDDGSTRDVTRDAVFSSSNFNVASVSNSGRTTGQVESLRRGETAILVRYEGAYAVNNITVLGNRTGYVWVDSPEFNFVDTHVNAKLRTMKIQAAELCTDAEFLRRVSLDLTGLPPTGEQVRAFLSDSRDSKTKREAKIDELLDSPEYVDHWTLKWSDLLLANRKFISEKGVWAFRNWIRNAIARNQPYDEFVRELVTANGSTFQNPPANYYRISREPAAAMENLTQVFIGTRFSCAKCHDHPFERWTQNQYYQLGAYFASVGRKPGSMADEEIIFPMRSATAVVNPRSNQAVQAAFPFQHTGAANDPQMELRSRLAKWLTAPENPYFATTVVNRYWSYLNGRGIIDPVDDIRSSNPPSNPALLKALVDDFVAHKMDLKGLLRTITRSHTYQRSFQTNKWNEDDGENFSHFMPRRLSAEQLFDAIMIAASSPVNLPGVPSGFRATQLPDPNIQVGFLEMFGRAPREIPCECERTSEVSLAQTLTLINGPTVSEAIVHPQGLLARSLAKSSDPKFLTEEIYLSVVNRLPTAEELQKSIEYLNSVESKSEAAQDLMWALMNSPAFLFNR